VRAAAALAVLALAGCGGGHAATPTPAPTSPPPAGHAPARTAEQEIETLLRDRASALAAGRRPPGGAGVQHARDRVAAARIRALRVRDLAVEAGRIDVHGARASTRVTVRYGIAGVRGMFQSAERVALVRRGGAWRVARAEANRGRPPWDVASFAYRRTPHFVVLVVHGAPVADLASALEDGYAAMRERLRAGRLRQRYLVIDAADAAQARALTTQIRGVETLAAVADAAIDEQGPAQAVSRLVSVRLLVVASAFASLDAAGRRRTIAHELTHAALAGATSGRTPAWLAEGVAMYVSGDRRPAPVHLDLVALSKPGAIARLSGDRQADAYGAASAAAFAIVRRFGADRLLDLYDSFNDESLRGPPGPRLVNRALHRELGIGLSDLK
jgi:hypothetical protein